MDNKLKLFGVVLSSRGLEKRSINLLTTSFILLAVSLQLGCCSQDFPPLKMSLGDKDVALRVGENLSFSINTTASYILAIGNDSKTLSFAYSVPSVKQIYIEPLPNITLDKNFSNVTLHIVPKEAGTLTVSARIQPPFQNYTAKDLFLQISIYKLAIVNVICEVVGWLYFIAWSISFYPQIIQNYQRKSVRGLSLEFVCLNITGFFVYSVYNIGLFWFKSIQTEYFEEDPTGSIPVQINDVVFSLHALFASSITGIQCLMYDRGSQNISYIGQTLICGIGAFLFIILVTVLSNAITWLTFLSFCSYIKLFITLVKYVPQAYLNYIRRSTSGWSIGNVLLDFTGGLFSLLQMLLIAYNYDDWFGLIGDFTKLGLGLFSITFDIFFIIQHYILYRNHREYEPIEGSSEPILNPHEDITTSNHLQTSFENESMPESSSVNSFLQPPDNVEGIEGNQEL